MLTENRYSADGTFKDFEAKLTEKYGPINFKSDDDSLGQTALFKGALYATRGWKLSATTIKLTYSRNSTNGDRRVGIRYISKAAREQSTKGL